MHQLADNRTDKGIWKTDHVAESGTIRLLLNVPNLPTKYQVMKQVKQLQIADDRLMQRRLLRNWLRTTRPLPFLALSRLFRRRSSHSMARIRVRRLSRLPNRLRDVRHKIIDDSAEYLVEFGLFEQCINDCRRQLPDKILEQNERVRMHTVRSDGKSLEQPSQHPFLSGRRLKSCRGALITELERAGTLDQIDTQNSGGFLELRGTACSAPLELQERIF